MISQEYADGGKMKNGNGSRLGTRLYLSVVLKRNGFEVVEAVDFAAVLAALCEIQPDLIIVDMTAPDSAGLELCRQVRARPDTSHHRVLGITYRGAPHYGEYGLAAGADTCLTKPIISYDLIAKIHDLLDDGRQSM
jgi:two-component system phosphate regulon response regulator PhoB